jgi:hypothetical protein
METEIHGDIKKRTGLAVVFIWQFARFEFKGFVRRQEGDFWHCRHYTISA